VRSRLFRLILGVLLIVPALAVILLVMALDDEPAVRSPRIAAKDPVAARGEADGIVNVRATIELPPDYPLRFVNVELDADRARSTGAVIRRVAVGAVDLPGWLAREAIGWAAGDWPELKNERVERAVIRALESYPDRLELDCAWPGSPVEHVRVRADAAGGRDWPATYGERVAAWAASSPGPRAPVLTLLRSLFGEAAARTAVGADPVIENRTAILVAAAQAVGCTPVEKGRPVRQVKPLLHRRDDLGRHFVASAALAVLLDRGFSDSVGLDKEVNDSREVSGFSFSDLAANLAGARFGDLATASERSARRVQDLLRQAASDTDIMPAVRDLPENLSEEVLRRRFGEPGAKEYQRVLEDIEARIASVPLYRVSK